MYTPFDVEPSSGSAEVGVTLPRTALRLYRVNHIKGLRLFIRK